MERKFKNSEAVFQFAFFLKKKMIPGFVVVVVGGGGLVFRSLFCVLWLLSYLCFFIFRVSENSPGGWERVGWYKNKGVDILH